MRKINEQKRRFPKCWTLPLKLARQIEKEARRTGISESRVAERLLVLGLAGSGKPGGENG